MAFKIYYSLIPDRISYHYDPKKKGISKQKNNRLHPHKNNIKIENENQSIPFDKIFLKNLTIERKPDTIPRPEFIVLKHVLPDM